MIVAELGGAGGVIAKTENFRKTMITFMHVKLNKNNKENGFSIYSMKTRVFFATL